MSASDDIVDKTTDSDKYQNQNPVTNDSDSQTEKRRIVESLIENRQGQTDHDTHEIASFVIDESFKNTEDNRNREATVTVPFLVRKTSSRNLVPRPWKSITQLIIVSYVSFLFCVITGAYANHYAWEAQRNRELGLLSEAKKFAYSSAYCIYISFVIGALLIVIIPPVVCCIVLSMC